MRHGEKKLNTDEMKALLLCRQGFPQHGCHSPQCYPCQLALLPVPRKLPGLTLVLTFSVRITCQNVHDIFLFLLVTQIWLPTKQVPLHLISTHLIVEEKTN